MLSQRNALRALVAFGCLGILASSLSACENRQASQTQTQAPPRTAATSPPPAAVVPQQEASAVAAAPVTPPQPPLPHYNIHFTIGSSQLSPEATATLDSAVQYLRENPTVRVKLSGYTDLQGSVAQNKRIAEARVASAAQFLEQKGIDVSRMTTVAVGEANPALAPEGENPATWNRRVELEFSRPPGA